MAILGAGTDGARLVCGRCGQTGRAALRSPEDSLARPRAAFASTRPRRAPKHPSAEPRFAPHGRLESPILVVLPMSTKREFLEHPTRDKLLAVVESFGLDVAARRAKAGLVEEVSRAKKSVLEDILGNLPGDPTPAFSDDQGRRFPPAAADHDQSGDSTEQQDCHLPPTDRRLAATGNLDNQ
jgi:hypothetical protein